ncbi:unnamed protein product [Arabidopsis lyrata]|uniref:Uncharacterized protein n=1 Tax=Arabidopsis lyrata subsp. lyrata TaxID=81972 RepID=D7M545_ARALL|nr:uncharacterized protein LOC9307604 [Arabidopsis lyrata subsp. lyrata]EFH49847.1 hypothetical protein ARALYDRAFT_909241 [Arabidopsis lyrata subsp. lyrata]CAH8270916.1 unnamed protein product [Arabidopsis lyrata]|eukprot:XP_002873588.1 uncharacterized protein LOC9307604 [Arabidopsis lyrata subsp. lyrata]
MDEPGSDPDPGSYPIPPASVHLAPFFSSLVPPLSAHFTRRCQPLQSSRPLAYISLQGLLVNFDEASSARSIGGGLSREEALAWELFTPYQRFLIVAVIGVAAAESKKNGLIRQLQKSVDLRDQVLSSMQQKLDDLCQELHLVKDQSGTLSKVLDHDDLRSTPKEKFGSEKITFVDCGCWLCDQHHHSSPAIQDKAPTNLVVDAEPEERRISYMSDWCSSVTSAAETHFDSLSLDQDMLSLRKECQEKDATIKDLTSFLQLTNKAGSKRETELEDIIRRKKTIIKKLKRDVLVLEEKVTQLTRLRRSSYSPAVSNTHEFPMRMDNLLYDMDVLTATSSSDSEATVDTPRRAVLEAPVDSIKEELSAVGQTHKSAPAKSSTSLVKSVKPPSVVSPSTTRKPVSVSSSSSSSRMRRGSSTGDSRKPRRPIQTTPRDSSGSHKRWV